MFVKGKSGNPGGRPKVMAAVREYAQKFGREAIDGLLKIARDTKMDERARVSAWNSVLDRAYGKPPQDLNVEARHELPPQVMMLRHGSKPALPPVTKANDDANGNGHAKNGR